MGQADDAKLAQKDKARSRRATGSERAGGNNSVFVEVNLTAEDKRIIKEGSIDPFDLLAFITQYGGVDYRLSIAPDVRSGAVAVYLTGVSEKCRNKGFTVSARARTAEKALCVLMYKVAEILPEDWSSHNSVTEEFMM